jgi:Group II intron, maturase-specific domain
VLAERQGYEPGTLGHQRDDWPAPPSPPHRAAGFPAEPVPAGWRQYYRYGNSSRYFAKLDRYVKERMALLLSKRHGRRGRGYGLKLIIGSGNNLGLERLTGTIEFNRIAHAAR